MYGVCVCVSVCVCERERERERNVIWWARTLMRVCVTMIIQRQTIQLCELISVYSTYVVT